MFHLAIDAAKPLPAIIRVSACGQRARVAHGGCHALKVHARWQGSRRPAAASAAAPGPGPVTVTVLGIISLSAADWQTARDHWQTARERPGSP
jgi:hypothetical protein